MRGASPRPAPACRRSPSPGGGAGRCRVDPRDAWRGQEGTRIDRLGARSPELNDLMKRQEAEKQAASRLPGFPRASLRGCRRAAASPAPKPASVVPCRRPPRCRAAGPHRFPAMPERGIESGEMGPAPDARPATEPPPAKGPAGGQDPRHLPAVRFPSSGRCCWPGSTPHRRPGPEQPHPVLLRLVDHAQLPNRFRLKAKD